MSSRPDAVIVGGGLAGAAAAAELARAGRHVVLCERESGPHDKVCGEFLSQEATLYLRDLGLDLQALGAHPINRLRLTVGRHSVDVALPFRALSLSRRVLDAALLARAEAMGADIRLGAKVQQLKVQDDFWRARLQDGETIDAKAAFLATGKHDLRGWKRPEGVQDNLVGFKLHCRLKPTQTRELAGHVEMMTFPHGYAGLELVEDGIANLCLLVSQDRFARYGRQWESLLEGISRDCSVLARRLEGMEPLWPKPVAISATPYGHLAYETDGPWRLGDQAAVIPSFTGDGMSIALHSARLAVATLLKGGDAQTYQTRLAHDIARPVRFATLLSLALVHPLWQTVLGGAARLLPGLATAVAGATRIPADALKRSEGELGGRRVQPI